MTTARIGAEPKDWTTAATFLGVAEDLLPVVADRGVPVSPRSDITIGKVPSRINGYGQASGILKWTEHRTTDAEIAQWSADRRYAMGIQCRTVRALDIDIADPAVAQEAADIFQHAIGVRCPRRSRSNSGKRLIAFRVAGFLSKEVLKVGAEKIELLGNRQQFVAAGMHPSGVRHAWDTDDGCVPAHVPEITAEQLARGWSALSERFPQVADPVDLFTEKRSTLRFESTWRGWFNERHTVPEIIERHGYVQDVRSKRYAPSSATGAACVREIPGHEGLWRSDHGSDPLEGNFDAWVAYVVLEKGGDLAAAEAAALEQWTIEAPEGFDDVPETDDEVPGKFKLLSPADLRALPPLEWLVRGVLPKTGIAAVYGPSGAGKSFLVLDLAAAIARGAPWFELRTKAAPVVYVALEGEGGMRSRAEAWSLQNGGPLPDRLSFVLQPMHIVREAKALAACVPAGAVVIIDTLNRAAPGADENSSQDMGKVIEGAKVLQRVTGGLVIVVHHTGKDATRGMRGHSSLFAALDGAIEVVREDKGRSWSVAKSKDGADGDAHPFDLHVVDLGEDADGERITSCVVTPAFRQQERPKLSGQPAKAFAVFQRLAHAGDGSVDLDDWRDEFRAAVSADMKPESADRTFRRVIGEMRASGHVLEIDGKYSEGFV